MSKIIYIASQRLPTEKAYGIQIAKTCEALAQSGASVELLIPTRRNTIVQNVLQYYGVGGFTVTHVNSPDFYWGIFDRVAFFIKQWIASRKLASEAMTRHADVIYSRDEFPLLKIIYYPNHPQLVFEAHRFSSARKNIYLKFKQSGVKIVAISQGIKDKFMGLGFKSEDILIARDGVDSKPFSEHGTKDEFRKHLGLPEDKIIVLYAGNLYPWKGANVLAEAAKHLKNFPHPNVTFRGWQSHGVIPMYLKSADILVLPNSGKEDISRLYTSPLKMFEYMSSGKPIVASDLPSIREVLNDKNATFFKPDDPQELALKIKYVADHPAEIWQKTQQALADVESYSWLKRASKWLF